MLGLLIVAARTLLTEEFGAYAYALAAGVIAAQLASGGLQVTLLRRLSMASDGVDAHGDFADALRARAVAGTLLAFGAALLAAVAARTPVEAAALAVIAVSPTIAGQGELWLQAPRAVGRLDVEAVASLVGRMAIVVAGIVALLAGTGLVGLAIAYLGGSTLTLVLSRMIARRFLTPGRARGWSGIRAWYVESLPLAIAGVASLLMFRIDVLLLEWLRGIETVAVYTTAYRPFEATLIVPVAVMAASFPVLVRLASDHAPIGAFAVRVGALLIAVASVLAMGGWVLGPSLLTFAFGPTYTAAGDLLRILILALPAMFLNALVTHLLIAFGLRWAVAAAMGAALVANVAVNLLLIPQSGATGAAIATVAGELVLMIVALAGLVLARSAKRERQPGSP